MLGSGSRLDITSQVEEKTLSTRWSTEPVGIEDLDDIPLRPNWNSVWPNPKRFSLVVELESNNQNIYRCGDRVDPVGKDVGIGFRRWAILAPEEDPASKSRPIEDLIELRKNQFILCFSFTTTLVVID